MLQLLDGGGPASVAWPSDGSEPCNRGGLAATRQCWQNGWAAGTCVGSDFTRSRSDPTRRRWWATKRAASSASPPMPSPVPQPNAGAAWMRESDQYREPKRWPAHYDAGHRPQQPSPKKSGNRRSVGEDDTGQRPAHQRHEAAAMRCSAPRR